MRTVPRLTIGDITTLRMRLEAEPTKLFQMMRADSIKDACWTTRYGLFREVM